MAFHTLDSNTMLESAATMASNFTAEVAYLHFHHTDYPNGDGQYLVYPNDQFDIGRKYIQGIWGQTDMIISSHHLRFWCVMYESDSDEKVSPMVYVRILSSNSVRICAHLGRDQSTTHTLGKGDPDTLLNDGDVLYLTDKISIHFQTQLFYAVQTGNLGPEQITELEQFHDRYLVTDRRLGIGAYGSVFVAVKQSNHRQLACKVIGASVMPQKEVQRIRDSFKDIPANEEAMSKDRRDRSREFMVLKDLCHPNIITLEKVICGPKHTYIFQELITGGDLLSYLDKTGPLSEAESAVITRQVVKAVDYLHDHGVVHRDIKPENILMTSWREGSRIVLTDFGQARTFEETRAKVRKSAALRMHSMVGTYGYTAPEVLNMERDEMRNKGYSKAVDIWSIGCMTATLMTNQSIFPNEGRGLDERSFMCSRRPSQRWGLGIMDKGREWQSIGRKAKSFIRGCLKLDEDSRLTAKQALLHEWFTNKHYAADIEAAYQRAIQDWAPRDPDDNIVEIINSSSATGAVESVTAGSNREAEQLKSSYFAGQQQDSLPPPPSLFFNKETYQTQFSFQPCLYPSNQPAIDDDETQDVVTDPVRSTTAAKDGHQQAQGCPNTWLTGDLSSDNFRHSPMFYNGRSSSWIRDRN